MTMIDEVQLQDRLGRGKSIVIDITADWCPPCRAVAPEFEKLSGEYTDVEFVKVDADENPALLERLGVMSIPTLVHFDGEGQEVARSTGAAPAAALAFRLKLSE